MKQSNFQLAIIIPAYKQTFLDRTLSSIAAQTCQDFNLYIGDDNSPYPIKAIAERYYDYFKDRLFYQNFDINIGGSNLVAQWERCIAMTRNEKWIWLFSDDDYMEANCVQLFYDEIKKNADFDIYHFNVKVINDNDKIIRIPNTYPKILSAYNYYKGKLNGKYTSLVVENIFSREIYERCNHFQNFDLAWGSDTATWTKFSQERGMKTISGSFIYWRSGKENISPDMSSPIAMRKMNALVSFLSWSHSHFKGEKGLLFINIRALISRMAEFKKHVSTTELRKAVRNFCTTHQCRYLYFPILLLIRYKK